MKRTLAIDLGDKRTGLAVTDELRITSQPLGFIEMSGYKKVLRKLIELKKEYNLERVVVGNPLNMDGTKGERAEAAERFCTKLKRDLNAEIVLWDERLTTSQAEKILVEANVSRKKRRGVIDQMAAQLILSNWLDANPL